MMRRRKQLLDELDQDIRDHLERETQDNMERGMSPEQARHAALSKFGNVARVKEETQEVWSIVWLQQLSQDVRFALRGLRKTPGFTFVAVLTLALGIGANTAIFSVVDAVLLKPLPYPNADQVFAVFQAQPTQGVAAIGWSYLNFEQLRAQNHVFSEVAGAALHQLTLTGVGEPTVVYAASVTPELFSLFAVKPLLGRGFYPEDGKRGAPPVVILSESLWRGTFGSDPAILGKSIALDQRSFTVVGVAPETFRFPKLTISEQVWIPVVQDPLFGGWMERRAVHLLLVIGRLKPGVSRQQAEAELGIISADLAREFPAENKGWTAGMMPLQEMFVGQVRPALLALMAAVGLVLLIACANLANLLLTRATVRAKEMALRTALGAGRARLIRQLLSETAVLGLMGGMGGIALAYWGVHALSALMAANLPRVNPIRVDPSVLGFALLLSAAAGVASGLAPALFAAHSNIQANLREGGGRAGESGGRRRARNILATAEIAIAMVLLVAAGLLMRSFTLLSSVDPGFNAQHLVKADISLPQFQYSTPHQWTAFSDALLTRLQAQPGLRHVAMGVPLPIDEGNVTLGFEIVGHAPLPLGSTPAADYTSVSPDYFQVMGIPLLAGRFFNQQDSPSAPLVAVISKTLARHYFPHQNPIGQRLIFGFPAGSRGVAREIVGIVGDVRDVSLGQVPGPMMYVPFDQAPFWGGQLVVRSNLSATAVAAAIRREVKNLDKNLPVTEVEKVPDLIDASVATQRVRTFLLGLFAAMALVLAATGIFGVMSYSVSRRTNEIGIRAALGASGGAILRMILRETLALVFAGLAVGLPCALAASHVIGHLLFGVSASDPATIAVVVFTLAAVATLAGFVPARRAMRVDPLVALRQE